MVYNDGMLVADHISTITHSPLRRGTPELLLKMSAKEKRSKASTKVLVMENQAAKEIHPNLLAISSSLHSLAKNFIVKYSLINPRLSYVQVM